MQLSIPRMSDLHSSKLIISKTLRSTVRFSRIGFNINRRCLLATGLKFNVTLCLLSFMLALLPLNSNAQNITQKDSKIVVLGDSISAAYGVPTELGWVSLLSDRLNFENKNYSVVNASISGETTDGGVKRLPDILNRHQPSIILIELGGNDGLRGFPLSVIRANIEAIVEQSKAMNAKPILLAMKIPPNYGSRYTTGFQDLYQSIAEKHNVILVPFFLQNIAVNPKMMQKDGIHPTALAQPSLLDAVWPLLKPLL